MIVLDASAVIELLLNSRLGTRVAARIASRMEPLHAPHLVDVEVAQVLRRLERTGVIDAARGQLSLASLAAMNITRHAHNVLLARVWALRANVTAYDACYLALAEALVAPLLTCDSRLAAAPGHRAQIEVIA